MPNTAEHDIGWVVNRLLRSQRVLPGLKEEVRRLMDNYTPEEQVLERVYVMAIVSESAVYPEPEVQFS